MSVSSIGVEERGSVQFVDVGVEDPIHEADAGTFVRVLVRELDVDFPEATLKGR